MVLEGLTGWKLRRKKWTGTTERLIKDLESAYENAPNMFSIRIHHGRKFRRLYMPPPWVRATIEDITDEPGIIAIIEHISKKMLLFTWHDSSEPTKEPVCDYVTPRSLPQYDFSTHCKDPICESITPRYMPHCMLTPPTDGSVITYTQLSGVQRVDTQDYVLPTIQSQFSDINLSFVSQQATASHVIKDVMRQLSFEETELDEEAGFGDVARSGIESSGLSHDDSYGVDDLYLNLNEPLDLNISQIETQFELPVSEESDVGRTQELIVEEVRTQESIVEEDDESAPSDGHFFYNVEGIDSVYETQYDVQSSEDAGTDDDDDFLVDEENEI
ncbi:hypothetical protein Tco_1158837, partial [Tanacetum coccineum]